MSVHGEDQTQGTPGGSGLEAAASTVSVSNDRTRQRFGRYIAKAFHARGGMGEVWLSSDSSLGREVALKVLRRDNNSVRARFVAEAQITGQLEHPGIVPIHDFGTDDAGQPYYVMKFVRGRTLKQAIAEYHSARDGGSASDNTRELQFVRLLQGFIDVCHAVAYAHSRGVFHRDIKPDNVMIGPYGETMLLDWGISKLSAQALGNIHCDAWNGPFEHWAGSSGNSEGSAASAPGSSRTCEGTVLGSPCYMSPEMAEGRSGDCDERTDVFLLGATLFEILTGKLPRQGTSRDELIDLARSTPPPPARQVAPGCPRPLEAVALKAMAYRREDRYGQAMELAEEIERYLAGEAVSACRESAAQRAWRWCRKHRRGLANVAISAIAVLLICATALAWRQAGELRGRERAAANLNEFLSLADEARFYAANKDSAGEQAPYFDPERGDQAATLALAVTDRWGTTLEGWPSPQSLPRLKSELSDLLVLTARERAAGGPAAAKASIAMLDRARALGGSQSQAYHAVRAECLELAGDRQSAAAEQQIAAAAPATAEDWFLRGEQLRTGAGGKGDISKALEAYRAALQARPNHFWAALQLGRCYMQLGRYSEAVLQFGTCVALRPNEPWGYCARGLCLALLKRYSEANHDFDSALAARPGFAPAALQKGVALWLQKRDEEALKCFDQLLQPGGAELAEAAYYRGQVRLDRGEYAAAVPDFDRFLAKRPGFDAAYLLRARAHLLLGQTDDCIRDLDGPPTANPGPPIDARSAVVMSRRARLLRQCAASWPAPANRQAAELARTLLSDLVRSGEASAQTLGDLGAVTARLGQPEAAVVLFSQALAKSPSDLLLLKLRGQALVALKRYSGAREDFSRVAALDASDGSAHSWLAYITALDGSGDPSDEAACALAVSPDDFEVYHNVACVYAQLSRNDQSRAEEYQGLAVAFLRRALQLWQNRLTGPDEIQLIRSEPAFAIPSLQHRTDFQRLLHPSS